MQLCGKRGTPLVFLHNVTGFIIGTAFEHGGITKDGAKMVNAVSNVPVPKFSVVPETQRDSERPLGSFRT